MSEELLRQILEELRKLKERVDALEQSKQSVEPSVGQPVVASVLRVKEERERKRMEMLEPELEKAALAALADYQKWKRLRGR